MSGMVRRWVMTVTVGAVGVSTPLSPGPGAAAVAAGDAPQGAAGAQALLTSVRGVPAPVCELVAAALRNSYSVSAGSRALGYGVDEVPAGGPAAWVLGPMRTPEAIPVLAAGLRDHDACVRAVSARLLGKTHLDSSRAVLAAAMTDGDVGVRTLATAALSDITSSLARSDRPPSLPDANRRRAVTT